MLKKTKKDKGSRSLSNLAWQRLKRNKLAMAGIVFICFAVIVASLGANIRFDQTMDSDDQIRPIAKKKPGFTVNLLKVRKNKEIEEKNFFDLMFFGGQEPEYYIYPMYDYYFMGRYIVYEVYNGEKEADKYGDKYVPQYKLESLADVVYAKDYKNKHEDFVDDEVTFYTIDGEKITESIYDLQAQVENSFIVERTFWLGTDLHGRDMMSRLMAGAIVSLMVGFIAVFISLILGISLGAIAGFFKGWVDDVIMWLINVVWSIPTLLLVIAITLVLGRGFVPTFIAVGFTMWVEVARIVRGQVLSVREREFIEAGRSLGFGNFRLIFRHVLPNVMGPVIIISAANFASAILIEAGLSFLGVGVQPPTPSWGQMVAKHRDFLTNEDELTYLAVLPGICVILMVLAFMLVGNGLRDALDTKSVDDVTPTG